MMQLVLVEDNVELRDLTARFLQGEGYQVQALGSVEELSGLRGLPQLYIIDLNLPGASGYRLIQDLRQASETVGIIIVSARDRGADLQRGYEYGADIYLTKPVDPDLLLAAVRRLETRLGAERVTRAGAVVDASAGGLALGDAWVDLSEAEIRLLHQLQVAGSHGLARWEIAQCLDLDLAPETDNAQEARISRLRRKLRQVGLEGPLIRARRNLGYVLLTTLRFRY